MDWRLRFITRTMELALSLFVLFVSKKKDKKDVKRFLVVTVLQSMDSNKRNSFEPLSLPRGNLRICVPIFASGYITL